MLMCFGCLALRQQPPDMLGHKMLSYFSSVNLVWALCGLKNKDKTPAHFFFNKRTLKWFKSTNWCHRHELFAFHSFIYYKSEAVWALVISKESERQSFLASAQESKLVKTQICSKMNSSNPESHWKQTYTCTPVLGDLSRLMVIVFKNHYFKDLTVQNINKVQNNPHNKTVTTGPRSFRGSPWSQAWRKASVTSAWWHGISSLKKLH